MTPTLPTFCPTLLHPSVVPGPWSPSLGASQLLNPSWKTRHLSTFTINVHIRPSHILLPEYKTVHEELTKSMTQILKPSADFPLLKLLQGRREGQCGSAVGKLKKLQTSWPDPFHPLYFLETVSSSSKWVTEITLVATLLFMLVLERPQSSTLRVS